MAQWQPILQWLEPVLHRAPTVTRAARVRPAAHAPQRVPVQRSRAEPPGRVTLATRIGRLLNALGLS
jgi:hypothetical protein